MTRKIWTYCVTEDAVSVHDHDGKWVALFPTPLLDDNAGNTTQTALSRAKVFIQSCGAEAVEEKRNEQ